MKRAAVLVVCTASLAALMAPVAGAARSACQRLAADHRDRSPNHRLVLVARGGFEVGDIAACILPRGKVRRLVTWDDGLGRDRYAIAGTRGVFVLIANSYGDQYGGTLRSLGRYDARTGRGVTLASYACQATYAEVSCPTGTSYGKVVLGSTGAGALERTDLATGVTELLAFDPSAAFSRLDDGPVDTLAVDHGEIVWTRSGAEHRVPLPGS